MRSYIYKFDKKHLSKVRKSEQLKFLSNFEISKKLEIKINPKNYFVNNKKINNTKIKAISLFSGAGGLDIGCQLADVEVLSCMDFDKDSIETLKSNAYFKNTEHFIEDIRNFNLKNYNKIISKKKPNKLILTGGPPCQPFSKAGYWVTHKNRLADKDPRNMITQYLSVIKQIDPDGFVLENVESILHPKNINIVKQIEEFIYKNNFNFIRFKCDAINYGVPQKRKRVFFIASKKKIKGEPKITHGENFKEFERVIDWIYKFDLPEYFEQYESMKNKTYEKEFMQIPPGKNYFELTPRDGHPKPIFRTNKKFWSFLLKLDPFKPSWTVPAQPGPWVGPLHWANRRLRVPEIAAIQSFPEDYIFRGSRRSIQKQIGNAVPPLLGKAIINFLCRNI